jgi:DNA-binding XRE family transcriptional regulator
MTVIRLQLTYRDHAEMRTELPFDKAVEDVRMCIEANATFAVPASAVTAAMDRKALGARVARLRKEKGMTQAELAAKVGRSTSWVGQVERGVRKLDRLSVLQGLGRALGDEASMVPVLPPGTENDKRRMEVIPARSVYRSWVEEE